MTTTTMLTLNALLALAALGALAAVVRLSLRLHDGGRPETLCPSLPLARRLVAAGDEEPDLAEAA
jgi:hypothetical protein